MVEHFTGRWDNVFEDYHCKWLKLDVEAFRCEILQNRAWDLTSYLDIFVSLFDERRQLYLLV